MEVVIPYQERYSIPRACCICGAADPTAKYQIRSKEVRRFATTASVTMTFMKCQACVDALAAIKKTEKPGLLLGVGLGLVVGVAAGAVLFLTSGNAGAAQQDPINELLGPIGAVGAIFALIGLIVAKAIRSITLDKNTRQKLQALESPVTILDFNIETGLLGNVKSAAVKLNFGNDAYARTFMALNHFSME